MRILKNLGLYVTVGACLMALVAISGETAVARPKYASTMTKQYPDLAKKHGKNGKLSCAVCHPVSSKKKRNNYGVAVGKNLGKKNQTDEEKIKEALVKAEKEKSHVEGKTFGDLIEAGELPGSKEVADE